MVIKSKQRKTNKKAQMKVNQMAIMLIAVTIFFAMVGLFLLSIRLNNLKETASALEEQNAILLVSKLANSPEFSCGDAFGGKRSNCVDFDKVMALKNNIDKYEDFWGASNLELKILHSVGGNVPKRECTEENYPNCESILLIEKPIYGFDRSSYVTVCKKEIIGGNTQDVCNLGILSVRYENVE